MPDLFIDDIQDPKAYTDEMILRDIGALIQIGQRESALIDYKKDISDKDNWPEAAAAFANTFGGLIVFGVEAKDDVPIAMPGLEPRGETSTRLANMLLSRIQPRPDFQVRVVKHEKDQTKEIAVVRIMEGSRPPYVHSKDGEHRVYVRTGARKAEADYLQLSALFEKRSNVESQAGTFLAELTGSTSRLNVMWPPDSNLHSADWYRFVLVPEDGRAGRRLTLDVERNFKHHIERTFTPTGPLSDNLVIRNQGATYFRRGTGDGHEQRFAVAANGSLGFVTHAYIQTSSGPFFNVAGFCGNLVDFLCLGASFYDEVRYYGECQVFANLVMPQKAQLWADSNKPSSLLFEPPLDTIHANAAVQIHVAPYPLTAERLHEYLEAAMNDLARMGGSVLVPAFRESTRSLIEAALKRLRD